MFRKVLFCASAVALIASCNEEETPWTTTGTSELKTVQLEDDLTFGYNSIITEVDSLSTVSIPLNTDVAPVISCSNSVADLQCVNIDGNYYLQVANPEQASLGVDEVTLTVKGRPELTKTFLFTVNKSYSKTRAIEHTAQEEKLYQRFSKVFSVGRYLWQGTTNDHPASPMFDANKLYASLSDSLPLFYLDQNFGATEDYQEAKGSTLEEHSNQSSINAGVSKIPLGSNPLSISGDFNKTDKSYSKHYYEYLTKSRSKYSAAASMSVSMTSTPAHDKFWKELITKELDNVLNNPGSNEYQKFAETDLGACEIIETYGSHLLTYCVLGTMAKLDFRKKQDLSKTSVEWALSAKIQQELNDKSLIKTEDNAKTAQYIDSKAASASGGYSKSYEDLLEDMEAEVHVKLLGGNANTNIKFDEWNATNDPENWIPVAYRSNKDKEADLIAIYELCQDPTSPRCQSLKRVMEEVDSNGHCPFVVWKMEKYGINLNPEETEWVLAGVYVDVTVDSDKDGNGNQNSIPKPIKMPLPANQNIKATFYPFTDLAFNIGNCLDTETSDFGRCVRRNCHYWYYAMMMRDDFPGIEEFRIVRYDKVNAFNQKGYLRSMKEGDLGYGWRASTSDDYVLMCKPIKEGDKTTPPITGFRLEAYDKDKRSTDVKLLGVSAPTGPGLYGEDDVYRYYWTTPENPGPVYIDPIKDVKDQDGKVNDVYHINFIHQPYHLFLTTTSVPVRQKDLHINHPLNMKH